MGASQSQFEPQPELHPQHQSQQFPSQSELHPQHQSQQFPPQSELHPQPQPQQLQPRPRRQPQLQQQQPQQPQSHEPTGSELRSKSRRETPLLSPQTESIHRTKTGPNTKVVVKANENQSLIPVKPKKELNFPHNYEHILKGADSPVDKSSREMCCYQLYAGVFLDHKTKKYWLEMNSNSNCFMLYARALSITWAEDQNYWKWVPQNDESGTMIELAELNRVCWLEVHGKFDTRKLSPGILYQVSFIVMLKDPAHGWEVPVNVRLVLPGGKKQEHKENLIDKIRARWIEIPVGEFVAAEKDVGEMKISMYEYEGGTWKMGLVIKGIAIKPKNYKAENDAIQKF